MMNKVYQRLYLVFALFICADQLFAQTLTDGPIQLQVRLRDVNVGFTETDAGVLGVGFAPDEVRIRVQARDNADLDAQSWQGPNTCHSFSIANLPQITPPINQVIFNFVYTTANVPQYYDLKMDNFEDDNPSDALLGFCSNGQSCVFDAQQCCGIPIFGVCVGLNEGDDKRCNADPFATQLPYRNGPPCQWFDQGYITGTCGNDWKPGIETYWQYTKGTSCVDAIDLGTINSGGTLTHVNSTACYTNTHAASPGNDVWYKFTANGSIGITADLCGVLGAQFDSYLYLYSACGQTVPDTANDDGCGTQSTLAYSICQPGVYYLVVDGKTAGDQGAFTLTVQDNPNFVFAVNPVKQDVSCFGGSDGQITANVQGGLPPYTYAWTPSTLGTGPSVSGLSGGTYSVTVTDFKGCAASATIQINVPTQMTAVATGNPVSCGGACDGSATVTAQNGTPPYSYAWNSLPPQQLQNATFLCANTYTVTVTDTRSCTVTATATVPNTTTVIITVDSLNDVRCFGDNSGGVFITATGGAQPLTYAWSNNVFVDDNPNLGPGNYTLVITDNVGCTAGDTYSITEPPVLTSSVSFTFNPRCNAGTDGIVNISVGGGVQPYTYLWSAPTNAVTQNLNNVVAGSHTVTVSDANSCTITSNAVLTEPAPFSTSITVGSLQCYGAADGTASVTVTGATSPYTYFWSNFETTTNVTGLDAGPFSVVIEDANGCDTILTGTVTSPAEIDIQLTAVEPLCADQGNGSINTVVTGGTPTYSYAWSGGLQPVQNPTAGTGSYTVTVTDANNCTESSSVGVNAPSAFTVNVVAINPTCLEDSTGAVVANTIGGNAPYSYAWSNSTIDTVALTGLRPGNFQVVVTDVNGCTAAGVASLKDPDPEMEPESCKSDKNVILVPTAFSPNGDNKNDNLVVIMRNVQKAEFKVFNRWGELVYDNAAMVAGDPGWNGVYKGREQPIGTYIWVCNVTYINGVKATENGSSTLIR